LGKKNRPARGRAIKPNGAKLYIAVFGGRELQTVFLDSKSKSIIYLFYGYFRIVASPFFSVINKKAAGFKPYGLSLEKDA
jgi:hypothetical protein